MLSFAFMMICRNPCFDLKGLLPNIKNNVLIPALVDGTDNYDLPENIKKVIKSEFRNNIDQLIRCLWISNLYRIFFKKSKGFYSALLRFAKGLYGNKGFQMILYKRDDNTTYFITSDNPAVEYHNAVTLQNYNGIYFPLSPDYLLLICSGDAGIDHVAYRSANDEIVRKFNYIICSKRNKDILARQKKIDEILP